jgi:transcriptional regulator with XRE-family HTH domain
VAASSAVVDDMRLGATIRAVRIRRRLRQSDVARLARTSDSTVSRIERGHLAQISIGSLRKVAHALEIQIGHRAWSRGGDLDRLLNARHAALAELVAERIDGYPGWIVRPEVSFAIAGERGVIDLLGWHAATRSLLVIELKTDVVDIGEVLGTLGRKARLGPLIASDLGWNSQAVSVALLIASSRYNRRRVAAHARLFGAAMPDGGGRLRSFLKEPSRESRVAALVFVSNRHQRTTSHTFATPRRVRRSEAAR